MRAKKRVARDGVARTINAALVGGREKTPKDEISNYPFVNGDKFKESGFSLNSVMDSISKINKVGQAIVKARQGDAGEAIDIAGDALAYVLEKKGVTSSEETVLFNQLYNGKTPTNLSPTFGALQPFQYYTGAYQISENKDWIGKHYNWSYRGRSPIDIAEEVMVHPYWEFDLDFGIWRMKKAVDDNYPFMMYPKTMHESLKSKELDMTKMWWWRGSWVTSAADIIEAARKADEQDADAVKYYANTLYPETKPRVLSMVRKINDVVEREYAALKKSYDLLEQALILQVAVIYAEKTERDPEKYVANWSKMDAEERAVYAKMEKLKPVDEKVVPRVDYYSDIRGRVKDRADKPKGEDEFEPIKSRDDWAKLWRRGYDMYKKTVDEEGAEGLAKLRAQLTEETTAEVAPKVAENLRKEAEAEEEKQVEAEQDADMKALKKKLRELQKIPVKDLTAEQKEMKRRVIEDIATLENPDEDGFVRPDISYLTAAPSAVPAAAPSAAPAVEAPSEVPKEPSAISEAAPIAAEQKVEGGGVVDSIKDAMKKHKDKLAIAAAATLAAATAAATYSAYQKEKKEEDDARARNEQKRKNVEEHMKEMENRMRIERERREKILEAQRAVAAAKRMEEQAAKAVKDAELQAQKEQKRKEDQAIAQKNREAMDKLKKQKADQDKMFQDEARQRAIDRMTLRKMEEQNKKNEEAMAAKKGKGKRAAPSKAAKKKDVGGWSTQNIELNKDADSEIKEQEQYHAILNKEIAKSDAKLKSLVKRNVVGAALNGKKMMKGKGQNFSSMDFKDMAAGNDPAFDKNSFELWLEQNYDPYYKKDYSDMSKDEIAKIHDKLWGDQQLSNDSVKLNWSNYDYLLKRYKIPRDSGIEKFRKEQNKDGVYRSAAGYKIPTSSATAREEAARWTTSNIVSDKVAEKLDVLEDKKAEIAKRLLSASEQKTRDDLEKLKTDLQKQIDALKKPATGGRVGRPSKMRKVGTALGGSEKDAGEPLKKLADEKTGVQKMGDKLSKGKDAVVNVINLANKAKGVYDKVDKFLDSIKPLDPNLPALEIAKEETRKDTDFQKKVLNLLDNYDELDAAEAKAEYEKLVREYQAQLKKISEREARQKRIKDSGYGKEEENVVFEIQEIPQNSKLMRHVKVRGGAEKEEAKPDRMKQAEKALEVADKLASQLEKFDGSKYKEDRTSDKVARTPTAPTKHNRGSGLPDRSINGGAKQSAKKPSAWNEHVKATKEANPGMPLKEVLKKASASYKK